MAAFLLRKQDIAISFVIDIQSRAYYGPMVDRLLQEGYNVLHYQ